MNATPTPSPAASGTGVIFASSGDLLAGLWLVLGFGLFAILIVIIFILLAQNRYFRAVEYLARRGMTSSPGQTQATISGGTDSGLAPPPEITITGPKFLIVGEPSEYAAKAGDDPAPVTWSVQGMDEAKIDPATASASVKVTPSESGPFAIVATTDDGRRAMLPVMAEKPVIAATVLGYVGAGWGSIVVAIIVAAIVGALGIATVLDGQAIAGLYGALIGYLFGVQLQSGGGTSGAQTGSGGVAGGTAGTGGSSQG